MTRKVEPITQNDDKCTFCRVLPWILALLFLLALIAILLFFFLFRHHHTKEQHLQPVQPLQPVQQVPAPTSSPCSKPKCGQHPNLNP